MAARFVRLGIAGFKSFADATSIEILPGLTGVVGPNGCGKSNVAEALRWAMGEANARSLRGGEMDDVIFAGTASRASRNLAEVTLNVEADENGLPPPFAANAELQVTRRIERGAGSFYRVNGREARARDVQTLFADMASGARSSAMVSQGRVGMLVSAKPEERRAVLEEAAGITGLHARRAEAETRLRAAEANLERAEERRLMLERQLEGLQTQARQAARYRMLLETAAEAEAGLLSLQRARAEAAIQSARLAHEAAAEALRAALAESVATGERATAAQLILPELRETEAVARTRLERNRVSLEGVADEAERVQAALAAAIHRRAQMERDCVHAETTLADSTGADARLVAEAARLRQEAEAYPVARDHAQAEALAAAAALTAADQVATAAAAEATEAAARADGMRLLVAQAEARFKRANEATERLLSDHARVAAHIIAPARVAEAEASVIAAEQQMDEARITQDVVEANRTSAIQNAISARESFARSDAARLKLAAETSALAEVLAVKDGEKWPPMGDRLQVPPGLEVALGAALGEELGAADDPTAARHWRGLPDLAPPELPGARIDDAVAAPALLRRALAGIGLVASTVDGDAAQPALRPGQCLVSPEGALWRWDGYTVLGGTATASAVRLRHRNRLASLCEGLIDAERTCDSERARRNAADGAEREAIRAEAEARGARRAAEAQAERARAGARSLRSVADQAASRLAAIDNQHRELAPEMNAARAAHAAALAEAAALPDTTVLRRQAEAARQGVSQARSHDAASDRRLDQLNRAEKDRQHRLGTIGREREDRAERAIDLAGRAVDLKARLVDAAADCERLAAAPAKADQAAQQAKASFVAAEARLLAASEARQTAEANADNATCAARSTEQAVFAGREAVLRAESATEAALQLLQAAEARVAERAGALPALPPAPADLSTAAEDRTRNRMHRLVRERDEMGPVNLRAEIELAAISADVAAIEAERAELGTAIAKLRGSIGHLNREGRERLTEVFQQVDRHFQALFARMFGGGRAYLALVGSDDPLLAGLEIYAQPPGKKLTSLSLLSGGEQALTALSLIFAVFRCNPAPLCVLDEVDAPLDDANVERFCTLLTDIVNETGTRFLVVTHHQLTMARMDRLYGVTMQERGVSRLLSVDLGRAMGMIEVLAAE